MFSPIPTLHGLLDVYSLLTTALFSQRRLPSSRMYASLNLSYTSCSRHLTQSDSLLSRRKPNLCTSSHSNWRPLHERSPSLISRLSPLNGTNKPTLLHLLKFGGIWVSILLPLLTGHSMYNTILTKASVLLGLVACWETPCAASAQSNARLHINLASFQYCSMDPPCGTRQAEPESSSTSSGWNTSTRSP